jgi:hypothetical protein
MLICLVFTLLFHLILPFRQFTREFCLNSKLLCLVEFSSREELHDDSKFYIQLKDSLLNNDRALFREQIRKYVQFESFGKLNKVTALLRFFHKSNQLDTIVEIVNDMKTVNFQLDLQFYTATMSAYLR